LLRAAPFWGRVGRPLARPRSTKPEIPDVAVFLPEAGVTAPRDKAVALKLLKRILKRSGRLRKIVNDGLCSYSAAMKELDNADRQEVGGRLNNRRRIRSSRFDEENGRCSGFDVRRRCRSSAQFTPGPHPVQSGAPSRHEAGLRAETLGRVGGVARTHGADRRLQASRSRNAQTPPLL
jgi:hypothetical protein